MGKKKNEGKLDDKEMFDRMKKDSKENSRNIKEILEKLN